MTHFPPGAALPRSSRIYEQAAAIVPCHPAIIAAFVEVEAAGNGYWSDKRLKNLPEPHWLYRLLPKGKRDQALRSDLAIRRWSRATYAKMFPGPNTAQKRYEFIDRVADRYGAEIATDMTSWGAGQVMGFNAEKCGFDSARDMYTQFADSEDQQIMAIVKYLLRSGGKDELQREDCNGLARIYNGSGQVDIYGPRLKRALAKWKKRSWSSAPTVVQVQKKKKGWLGIGDEGEDVREVQRMLVALGYFVQVDGDFGTGTRKAVREFQHDRGLRVDGMVGTDTIAEMGRAKSAPEVRVIDNKVLPAGRYDDTAADLLKQGSSTVRRAKFGKLSDVVTAAGAGSVGVSQVLAAGEDAQNTAQRAQGLLESILPSSAGQWIMYVSAAIVLLSLIGWWRNHRIEQTRVDEHRTGKVRNVGNGGFE